MSDARFLIGLRTPPVPIEHEDAEWLVTNGLGGYAMGSIDGPPRRRFHGLLVAGLPAPYGRMMLVHALEERVELDAGAWHPLRLRRDAGDTARLPASFCLEGGLPHWEFTLPGIGTLAQSVMMPHGQNTVHVRYRLDGNRPIRIRIRPWLDFRPHEARLPTDTGPAYYCRELGEGRLELWRDELPLVLRLQPLADGARSSTLAETWTGVAYVVERDRGYDHVGVMHALADFEWTLVPGQPAYLTASAEAWGTLAAVGPDYAWRQELARRERVILAADPALRDPDTYLLALAADQFVIRPATRAADETLVHAIGSEPRTIIAGYPWFTDWGRDTMISLEGLTLVTGRHREARDILRSFAMYVSNGLIPNLFPEGEREGLYHTADATLWFFHAVDRYCRLSGDVTLVAELLPVLEDIVRCHLAGTLFNIRIEPDGLLAQGAEGRQLTWMDALMDGWVVTPRRGKAVEINALWHNALCLLSAWLADSGKQEEADVMRGHAGRCRAAFNARFWNPAAGHLFDVVDGEAGDDPALRPNQVLAIALPHPPLDEAHHESVLRSVADALLTPVGLRTLSPAHPDYKPRYFGDLRTRDAAYHQGTVWPWLLGPFVDAWLKVHPRDIEGARTLMAPLLAHLTSQGCIGSINEIFDAEAPFVPRGCCAQAWSVAELARLIVRLSDQFRREWT